MCQGNGQMYGYQPYGGFGSGGYGGVSAPTPGLSAGTSNETAPTFGPGSLMPSYGGGMSRGGPSYGGGYMKTMPDAGGVIGGTVGAQPTYFGGGGGLFSGGFQPRSGGFMSRGGMNPFSQPPTMQPPTPFTPPTITPPVQQGGNTFDQFKQMYGQDPTKAYAFANYMAGGNNPNVWGSGGWLQQNQLPVRDFIMQQTGGSPTAYADWVNANNAGGNNYGAAQQAQQQYGNQWRGMTPSNVSGYMPNSLDLFDRGAGSAARNALYRANPNLDPYKFGT